MANLSKSNLSELCYGQAIFLDPDRHSSVDLRSPSLEHSALGVATHQENIDPSTKCCLFYQVAACFFYAVACAIFFKRSFVAAWLPAVVAFVILGVFVDIFLQASSVITLCVVLVPLMYYCSKGEWWNKFNYNAFLFFFLSSLDCKFGFLEMCCQVPTSYLIRIVIIAFPQFLRKPAELKAMLQTVRATAGPVYVMYTVMTAREITQQLDTTDVIGVSTLLLSCVASVSAIIAGTLFRPDNGVLLRPLYPSTTLMGRRTAHGKLMTFSLLTILASTALYMYCIDVDKSTGELTTPDPRNNSIAGLDGGLRVSVLTVS